MGGDTDMDRALGCIELRPGLEQIERRADRRRAQGLPGLLVITAPQPAAQAFAADRPGFPVALDPQIGKGGAGGGMKELDGRRDLEEHVGKHGVRRSMRCRHLAMGRPVSDQCLVSCPQAACGA